MEDAAGGCEYEVTFDEENDVGVEQLYSACQKQPGHKNFIPIHLLCKEILPEGHRTDELVELIHVLAALTARLTVKSASHARPRTWPSSDVAYPSGQTTSGAETSVSRKGTGLVESVRKMFPAIHGDCPCPECASCDNDDTPRGDWWEVRVMTATHLVFDGAEARNTTASCFFNHHDASPASYKLHGIRVCSNPQRIQNDCCVLTCVTHDADLGQSLEQLLTQAQHLQSSWSWQSESFFRTHTLMVVYPHGIPRKAVTMGRTREVIVPVGSKYPINQPIPFLPGTIYSIQAPLPSSSSSFEDGASINDQQPQQWSTVLPASEGLWTQDVYLPNNVAFVLPDNAQFVRKYLCGNPSSFTFPRGTRYVLADESELPLPPEIKFAGWSLDDDVLICVTYTNPICPGSSGAPVFTLEPRRLQSGPGRHRTLDTFIHSRSVSGDAGKSAYSFYVNPETKAVVKDTDANCILRGNA